MLFLLAVFFLPCALVGAFVTADEHDVLAFQMGSFASSDVGGLFVGATDGTANKSPVTSTNHVKRHHRQSDLGAPMKMLVDDPSLLPSSRPRFASLDRNFCSSDKANFPSQRVLLWPAIAGSDQGNDSVDHYRRGSFGSSSASALQAMAIPARCALPSVDLLREAYGTRRNFWGDLSARETRRFYHELLPVTLRLEAAARHSSALDRGQCVSRSDDNIAVRKSGTCAPDEGTAVMGLGNGLSLEEQARLASTARHAARLYARERCALPSRVVAHLYDGLRHLKEYGTFRVTGMTWEELWAKYEAQVRAEKPDLSANDLKERVCLRILEKSCSTSPVFDRLTRCGGPTNAEELGVDATLRDVGAFGVASADSADADCCDVSEILTTEQEALTNIDTGEGAAAIRAGVLRLARLIKPFRSSNADDGEDRKRSRRRSRKPSRLGSRVEKPSRGA